MSYEGGDRELITDSQRNIAKGVRGIYDEPGLLQEHNALHLFRGDVAKAK